MGNSRSWMVLFLGSIMFLFEACTRPIPSVRPIWTPVANTNTPTVTLTSPVPTGTPTKTLTPLPTITFTLTGTRTLSATPTWTPTPFPTVAFTLTNTKTLSPTPTQTPTPDLTQIFLFGTRTFTSTYTFTPTRTLTTCATPTMTVTGIAGILTSAPSHYIAGAFDYTGSGVVDGGHQIRVGKASHVYVTYPLFYRMGGDEWFNSSMGNYVLGVLPGGGVFNLRARLDLKGSVAYIPPEDVAPGRIRYGFPSFVGERFSCTAIPVTVTASSPVTLAGPQLTLDDSCGFTGVYGAINYTGSIGTVQLCRKVHLQAFLDAAFTTQVRSASSWRKPMTYNFVTNDPLISPQSGTAPLYLRAWYDANGNYLFDTGDPYFETGPVAIPGDGTQQDISFGDLFIR